MARRANRKLFAHIANMLIVGEEDDFTELVEMIARRVAEAFGGFLLIDIWAGPEPELD